MELMLHSYKSENETSSHYQRAFKNATELFVVSAYLTEWDKKLKLNPKCQSFRIIIGKDFGITRKAACVDVMEWLLPNQKGQFLVADRIPGFHPKAVIWKEANGRSFAIVGSSNLTKAAFATNYEANVYCELSKLQYADGKRWVRLIEGQSIVVSEDWLKIYREAPSRAGPDTKGPKKTQPDGVPLVPFELPQPKDMKEWISVRRHQLLAFGKKRTGLMQLFRRCASGEISSQKFYEQLPKYWSAEINDRLQAVGWEILGKHSNFRTLSESYVKIVDTAQEDRDDVVEREIDKLTKLRVPTRKAFLSEMLCLRYPEKYPVLNAPVQKYLKAIKLKAPRGASDGVRYIDLARKLRFSLLQNPYHLAKNLAELDCIIWLAYGKRN